MMKKSGGALEGKGKTKGRGLLAFFYGDVLVDNTGGHNEMLPPSAVRLACKEERDMIKRMLTRSGRKIRFCSQPATASILRERLNSGCEILHYTGHGDEHSLKVESEEHCGTAESLQDEHLRNMISGVSNLPELVFLGACSSEMCGKAVAEAGVPHVVAVESGNDVSDEAAQEFCIPFYEALITGNYTVQKAFDIAVSSIRRPSAFTTAVPASFLLLPEDANHEVKMFNDLPKGDFIDDTPSLRPCFRLPAARRTYIGGNKLWEIVGKLEVDNNECVTITGEPGIGKTELALQACHYMRERNRFSAIFFVHCRDVVAYQRSIATSRGPQAHIERLCHLVGAALDVTPAVSSPKTLWSSLCKLAKGKNGNLHSKVLLVLDAVDALTEGGESDARESLAKFIGELIVDAGHLKLLVTSDKGLKGSNDCCLNYHEEVYPVDRLGPKASATLMLNLYPIADKTRLEDEMGIGRDATREELVNCLQGQSLLHLVNGHPGVMCQVSPLLTSKRLDHPDVRRAANRYLKRAREKNRSVFSSKRAFEVSQAKLSDKRCREIWLRAVSTAADDPPSDGETDDTLYRQVPWRHLSFVLNQCLCEVQTTYDGGEMSFSGGDCSWSESSSSSYSGFNRFHGSSIEWDSSKCARDLDEDELNFIRDRLREEEVSNWRVKNSTGNATAGGDYPREDDEKERFSLDAFAKLSEWLGPVIATLSKMQNDWTAIGPVKVHGFVSRRKAKHQLMKTGKPGVFVLRSSVRKPGKLVLSFTCKSQVPSNANANHSGSTQEIQGALELQECFVTVNERRWWTRHYEKDSDYGNSYGSLSELVLGEYSLETLYPNIQKVDGFKTT